MLPAAEEMQVVLDQNMSPSELHFLICPPAETR